MAPFDPNDLQRQAREILGGLALRAMSDPKLAPIVGEAISGYSKLVAANPEIAGLVQMFTRLATAGAHNDPESSATTERDDVIDVDVAPPREETRRRLEHLDAALRAFESDPVSANAARLSDELDAMRAWLNQY